MTLLIHLGISPGIQFHELLFAGIDIAYEIAFIHTDYEDGTDLSNLVYLSHGFLILVGEGHRSRVCPTFNGF